MNCAFWSVLPHCEPGLCVHSSLVSPVFTVTQESTQLFYLPPLFVIGVVEILSFQELTVLASSNQECGLNSPGVIFQAGDSVSTGCFLEWECGGIVSVCEWEEGVCPLRVVPGSSYLSKLLCAY